MAKTYTKVSMEIPYTSCAALVQSNLFAVCLYTHCQSCSLAGIWPLLSQSWKKDWHRLTAPCQYWNAWIVLEINTSHISYLVYHFTILSCTCCICKRVLALSQPALLSSVKCGRLYGLIRLKIQWGVPLRPSCRFYLIQILVCLMKLHVRRCLSR